MDQNFMEFQNNRGSKKKKFDFKQKKKNTLKSISDVEYFLRDFKRLSNYIKLYRIMK